MKGELYMTDLEKQLRLVVAHCNENLPEWALVMGLFSKDGSAFTLGETTNKEEYGQNPMFSLDCLTGGFLSNHPNSIPYFSIGWIMVNGWKIGIDNVVKIMIRQFNERRATDNIACTHQEYFVKWVDA